MANRNEQFLYTAAIVAIVLPALAWLRYVGPMRTAYADQQAELIRLADDLQSYGANNPTMTPEIARREIETLSTTRHGIQGLIGQAMSVSETSRRIESVASQFGLKVVRIEPGRENTRSIIKGPLERASFEIRKRSYRIEMKGPVADIPAVLSGLTEQFSLISINEIRLQMNHSEHGMCSVSLDLETIDVSAAADTEGGG